MNFYQTQLFDINMIDQVRLVSDKRWFITVAISWKSPNNKRRVVEQFDNTCIM